MRRIVLLTRGDSASGLGHLYRASWLAAALAAQSRSQLDIAVHCIDGLEARAFWAERGVAVEFLLDYNRAAERLAAGDVCVVDWLDTPVVLIKDIAGRIARAAGGGRLCLLDEYGPALYHADLVINALLAPLTNAETVERGVRVLSGAAYVQLPLAALRLRGSGTAVAHEAQSILDGPPPKVGPVHSVLLSFGGTARADAIELALQALRLARYGGTAIVMPATAEQLAAAHGGADSGMQVEYLPGSDEFHDYLAAADLAILAGGLSLYEAAFFGVPAVCLPLVEHQLATARKLERAGCCRLAGMPEELRAEDIAVRVRALLTSPRLRGRMSFAGSRLIDGRGLQRTVDAILELIDSGGTGILPVSL